MSNILASAATCVCVGVPTMSTIQNVITAVGRTTGGTMVDFSADNVPIQLTAITCGSGILPLQDIAFEPVNATRSSIVVTPRLDGSCTVTVIVTDASGASANTTFVITVFCKSNCICVLASQTLKCTLDFLRHFS